MSAGGAGGANSPKLLTKPRPDIVFSTYTMKVLSPDKNYESVELEVHDRPDPYFSLNNPNDYKYRSKIKSVKLTDTVYAYGIDLSDLGRDTEQQKIARLINKVFKNKKTKCIIYKDHLIFNKIPTIGIIIKSQESSILDLIYSWDIYNVATWNDKNDKVDNNYGTLIRVPYFSDIPLLSTIFQPEVVKDKKLKTGLGVDNIRFIQSTNALTPYPTKLHDFNSLYIERELGNVSYYSIINLFAGSNESSKFYNNSIHKPSKEDLDQFFTKYGMTDDVNRVNNYLNSDSDETGIGGLIGGAIIGLSTIMIPIVKEMVETKHIPVNIPIDINESDIVGLEEPTFEIDTSQSRTTKEIADADYPITILLNKNQSTYRTLHDAIDINLQNVIRSNGDINYIFMALHRLPDTLQLKRPGSVGIIYSLEYDSSHGENNILQYSKVDRIVGKFDNTHPISRREIIDLYKANESVFIVIQDGSYEDIQIDLPEENILLTLKDAINSGRLTDDKIRSLTAVVEIQDMRYLGDLSAVAFGISLDPRFNTLNEQAKFAPAMYYVNSRYIHRNSANEIMPFRRDSDPIVGVFGRYEAGTFRTITDRFAGPGDTNTFRVKLEPILQFVKEMSRDELAKYTLDAIVALDTNSNGFYNKVSTFIYDKVKEFALNDSVMDTKKDICGDALILRNFNVLKKRLVVTEFKPDIRKPDKGVYDTREITHHNDAKLGKRISKYWGETGDNNINPGKIYYSGLTGMGFSYSVAYNLRGFYPLFSIRDALTLDEPYYDPKLAPFKRLTPSIRTEIRAAGSETFLSDTKRFTKIDGKPILSSIYLPNSGYKRRSYGNQYYDDKLESTVNRNLISSSDGTIHEAYATDSYKPHNLSPINGHFDVLLSKALPTDKWLPDGMMYDFDGLPFNKEWFVVNLWNNKEKDELIETKRFPTRITKENITDYSFALFRPILEGNYIEFDDGKTDNALKGNPLVRMKLDVESGTLDVNNIEHTTLKVKVHKSLRISQPWSVSAIALGVDLVGDKRSYDYIDSIVTRYLNRTNTTQLPITGLFSRASANSRYEPFLTPLSHLESEDYKVYTIDLKPIINYVKKTSIDTLIKQKLDLAVLSGLESKYAFNYISVSSLKGGRTVDKGLVNSGINLMHHYDYRDTLVITKAPDELIGTIPAKSTYNMNLDIAYSGESTVAWATRSNLDHGNLTSGGGDSVNVIQRYDRIYYHIIHSITR